MTVYCEGYKKAPLRVTFRRNEEWEVGNPEDGVIWSKQDSRSYNLNQPSVVASVIRHSVKVGWSPHSMSSPLEIQDGFSTLPGDDYEPGLPMSEDGAA